MPVAGAIIGAGASIYGANQQKKSQKAALQSAERAMGAADPYAPYRAGAAKRLDEFSQNEFQVDEMGDLDSYSGKYKDLILDARMQAAERQSAAQGYTGSGNALVAAANAGTEAIMYGFQLGGQDRASAEMTRGLRFDNHNSRFDQLAKMSGADGGLQAAAGISGAVSSGQQNVGQARANLANTVGSGIAGVLGAFGKKRAGG